MDFLLDMGFKRDKIVEALRVNKNDVNLALDWLWANATPEKEEALEEVAICQISQYSFSAVGSSACTPVSCTMLGEMLTRLSEFSDIDRQGCEDLMTHAILEGITSYSNLGMQAAGSSSTEHLSVEECFALMPSLSSTVQQIGWIQGILSAKNSLESVFEYARKSAREENGPNYIGIVITKPPETLCIFLPLGEGKFYMFDSHSRPQMGIDGSYLVATRSAALLADRLHTIFPVQRELVGSMYDMFEASLYICKRFSRAEAAAQAAAAASVAKDCAPVGGGRVSPRGEAGPVEGDYVIVDHDMAQSPK